MGLCRVAAGTWGTFSDRKEGNESCIAFSNFLLLLRDAIEPLLNTSSNNGACGEIDASCKARAKAETRVSSDAPVCRDGRTDGRTTEPRGAVTSQLPRPQLGKMKLVPLPLI